MHKRELKISTCKAEECIIPNNNSQSDWIKCKILGNFIHTNTEIENRKTITINRHNKIFKSKIISTQHKTRIFKAYAESVFFYNSELWASTQTLEDKIDAFQHKLPRKILKYTLVKNHK